MDLQEDETDASQADDGVGSVPVASQCQQSRFRHALDDSRKCEQVNLVQVLI